MAKSASIKSVGRPNVVDVIAMRESVQVLRDCGITEAQGLCADWLVAGIRSWQQWERGERGMHPAFWELANIKFDRFLEKMRGSTEGKARIQQVRQWRRPGQG